MQIELGSGAGEEAGALWMSKISSAHMICD